MNNSQRSWQIYVCCLILLFSVYQTTSFVTNTNWEWGIGLDHTSSGKFLRLRDTQMKPTQMNWGADIIVKENIIISAKIISILSKTSLAISLSSSDGQSMNQIIDICEYLTSEASFGLGRTTFYLPSSVMFWESLATNLSQLPLENLVVENEEKTFSFKAQEYSPFMIEWSFDKNTGVLRYFLSELDSHETIHLKRTDIIKQENANIFIERSILSLGGLSIFTIIILIIRKRRAFV